MKHWLHLVTKVIWNANSSFVSSPSNALIVIEGYFFKAIFTAQRSKLMRFAIKINGFLKFHPRKMPWKQIKIGKMTVSSLNLACIPCTCKKPPLYTPQRSSLWVLKFNICYELFIWLRSCLIEMLVRGSDSLLDGE